MSNAFAVVFCAIFVVSVIAIEWAVFGDEFEAFEQPDVDNSNWWDDVPILGAIMSTFEGIYDSLSLIFRLLVFDVPSLSTMFGGWLRWLIVVPLWTCLTYIIVEVVWI